MAEDKRQGPDSNVSTIDTAILCRELGDGDVTCAPVADGSLVSYGSESSALDMQQVFLAEYLLAARPEVLARFVTPPGVELREVTVILRRSDLPRRLQIDMPVTFPCLLVPQGRDHWVFVPTLSHTFHVARNEDLDEIIQSEIQRVVGAGDYDDQAYLRLFPAESHELVTTTIAIAHGGEGIQGRAGSLRKKQITEHRRKEAVAVLDAVAMPLHHRVPEELPGLVG